MQVLPFKPPKSWMFGQLQPSEAPELVIIRILNRRARLSILKFFLVLFLLALAVSSRFFSMSLRFRLCRRI